MSGRSCSMLRPGGSGHIIWRALSESAWQPQQNRTECASHRQSDGDEVSNEEERLKTCKCQSAAQYGEEYVDHALLSVDSTDFNNLFTVCDRGFFNTIKLDVCLDKLNRSVGSGYNRLHGSASE